jgi:hypothetical protein
MWVPAFPAVRVPSSGDMFMIRKLMVGVVAVTLAAGGLIAGELKSGPQAGSKVPGPFHPLNVTGEDAGKKACLYCKAGDAPVVAIFARNAEDANLKKLIAAIDAATEKNSKADMNSFVVFLSADDKLEGKLKKMAEEAKLKKVVLSIEAPEGPAKYNIAKDADVTVLLYTDHTVKANYAFEKGKLTDKDVAAVVADVTKILPAK